MWEQYTCPIARGEPAQRARPEEGSREERSKILNLG